MDIGKPNVVATSTYCSVSIHRDRIRACVEANFIDDDWWISRALVNPKEVRGQGIGGRLLERLKREIKKMDGRHILVTPGGYGGNKRLQRKFYRNHGFDYAGAGILKVKL